MQLKPLSPTSSSSPPPLPLRIITHNIRYAANPSQRFPTEPPWSPTRHALLARQLRFLTQSSSTPAHSVIFLQEVLAQQFRDVSDSLGDEWTGLGVGRDDGKQRGEFEGIWHRQSAWRKAAFDTRWLNEDGAVGKKGWDAASVRVVSCLVVDVLGEDRVEDRTEHDVQSGERNRRVLFMNTHFDDQGFVARRESAKLILRILQEFRHKYKPDFWVVGGDLNSPESDDAYEVLAAEDSGLVDAKNIVPAESRWGEESTYTGFDGKGDGDTGDKRIDFLFLPKSQKKTVNNYAVIPNAFEDSKEGRVSDHRAVVVDILLP